VSEFYVRSGRLGRPHASCRACKAEYNRAWYERNHERHKEAITAARLETRAVNKALVNEAKNRPCADCGRRCPPCVMDFDHVRGVKLGNIAQMKQTMVTRTVADEIAKCDVVCANCHRLRSYGRQHAAEGREGSLNNDPKDRQLRFDL
jgi:hypothetical protein